MKSIPINPKYLISEDGLTIINEVTGNRLKIGDQMRNGKPTGYKYASLIFDTEGYAIKRMAVHRLVAFAYLPVPDPSKVWINHKDGNKANNHYTNLEWTTISENIQRAHDTGLANVPKGEAHWLYGKKQSIETRCKMALAKRGEKHPKFKGWYVVNFKKYARLAEASFESGIKMRTLFTKCKTGHPSSGFYFIPKESTTD